MSKILRKMDKKKEELLERKIGENKKQNRLSPIGDHPCFFLFVAMIPII